MSPAPAHIMLIHRPGLAALGLDSGELARRAAGLPGRTEVRLIEDWRAEQLGPLPEPARIFVVGPGDPPAALTSYRQRLILVDLKNQMPWLAGEPIENALSLVKSVLAEAGIEPERSRIPADIIKQALIIGRSAAARVMASVLDRAGIKYVWAASPDGAQPEGGLQPSLIYQRLVSLNGFAGRFTVRFETGGAAREIKAGAVILCGREARSVPAVSGPVKSVSLADLERTSPSSLLEAATNGKPGSLVFLAGPGQATSTHNMRRIMEQAIRVGQETKAAVYILAPQVKVAAENLERLYGQAREAGIVFLRTPDSGPRRETWPDGRTGFKVFDAASRAELLLKPDLIVWEDALEPASELADWAANLNLGLGPDGFLGPNNVLFLPAATNRRGVMALGPARGTDADETLAAEIAGVLDEVLRLWAVEEVEAGPLVIETGRCASCLTCLRVCPHAALGFTHRPWPDPLACQSCGLCAAACPGRAIKLPGHTFEQGRARLETLLARPRPAGDFVPRLVLFGCRRSAVEAWRAAPKPKQPVDLALMPLPCGGNLDAGLVLQAFQEGADGVMAAVCHDDNCRSQAGGPAARRRVEHLKVVLEAAGLNPERLASITLAPNMGVELGRLVLDFQDRIKTLGSAAA
ncbi:MAG: hydrogenase iron-sulfur subunit [Thermodesulfobacteriota bacterium]